MRRSWTALALLVVSSFITGPVWAGNALKTDINGDVFHWPGKIILNIDQGSLGNLSNAQAVSLIEDAIQVWTQVPGINLDIEIGESLPDGGDTTVGNFMGFYSNNIGGCYDEDAGTPCYIPVIFDQDGQIIDSVLGDGSATTIAGYASITTLKGNSGKDEDRIIRKGQVFLNGACLGEDNLANPNYQCHSVYSVEEFQSVVIHELGHLIGLGHSALGYNQYESYRDGGSLEGYVLPTMFPYLVDKGGQTTLHSDDIDGLKKLYGSAQGSCKVSGNVFYSDGTSELRGAQVIARPVNDPFGSAVSTVSGHYAPRLTVSGKTQDNCIEGCGTYQFNLVEGETYQICVNRIDPSLQGSKLVGPVSPPVQGFDNDCPEGVQVTCHCDDENNCDTFSGMDIVTQNQGLDKAYKAESFGASATAGGCSLVKKPRKPFWPVFKRLWSFKIFGQRLS